MIKSSLFPTSLGTCGIAWNTGRLRALVLPGPQEEETREHLARVAGSDEISPQVSAAAQKLTARIQKHLDGSPDPFLDVPLDLSEVPDFSRKVYLKSRKVAPPGQTVSYGQLAARCGRPGGARAVGAAMARNPIPLVVPCHRVLGSDGELRGFSAWGGVRTKLRLLTIEGADQSQLAKPGPRVLKRADPKLAPVIRRVGAFALADTPKDDAFTMLARSIVHQQVSMAAGRTIFERARNAIGGDITPANFHDVPFEELRSAGLSRQKASYLLGLAESVLEGELPLDRLEVMDDEEVIEKLTACRGLGRWTAEMYLIFHLRRLDVLPVGDLGLKKGVQRLYGLPEIPTVERIREIAEPWIPYRSLATWYLWRSLDAGGLQF